MIPAEPPCLPALPNPRALWLSVVGVLSLLRRVKRRRWLWRTVRQVTKLPSNRKPILFKLKATAARLSYDTHSMPPSSPRTSSHMSTESGIPLGLHPDF